MLAVVEDFYGENRLEMFEVTCSHWYLGSRFCRIAIRYSEDEFERKVQAPCGRYLYKGFSPDLLKALIEQVDRNLLYEEYAIRWDGSLYGDTGPMWIFQGSYYDL